MGDDYYAVGKITCSECGSSDGPFSNRQMKKGLTARCTPCIAILFRQQEEEQMDERLHDDNYAKEQATTLEKAQVDQEQQQQKKMKKKHDDEDDAIEENVAKKRRKVTLHDDDGDPDEALPTNRHAKARTLQVDLASHKENKHRKVYSEDDPCSSDVDDDDEKPAAAADPAATGITKTTATNTDTTQSTRATSSQASYDEEAVVSINAIKRKIMRRDLETNEDDDDDDATKQKDTLRQELSCVICHELLYDPVSLPNCGHSFCAECWAWWEAKSRTSTGVLSCPTCRTVATTYDDDDDAVAAKAVWKPTRALQVAIAALFPNETADRKLTVAAGENEGRHKLGNAVILPIQEDDWRIVVAVSSRLDPCRLQARRSIVLDDTDRLMVYGLAIHGKISWDKENGTIYLSVCRVHLEQDEAEESFPVHVTTDSDDECLIVPQDNTMIAVFDAHGPVARYPISSRSVELRDMMTGRLPAKCYSIRHESTGCELQIQAMPGNNLVADSARNGRAAGGSRSLLDEGHFSTDEDEEAEAAAMEEEEEEDDDGFLVDENVCQICNDGGELLVCDGGDRGGCTQSFHVACIGRRFVPAGDWICQACAAEQGIDTGEEGHEFPEDSDDDDDGAGPVYLSDGDDEDDEEEQEDIDTRIARHDPPAAASRQRRAILIDSDYESD
jgi:hypothetical protein